MRKNLFTMIAGLATAMLLNASGANAAVYKFTFNSFDDELTATGEITVNPAEQVTAVSGVISGLVDQTITAVTPNPNFSSPAYSPDGSFIYNNVYYPTGMAFDTNGLLFVTAQNSGGYWNLWGTSPGNYSLWESVPDRGDRNSERGGRAGTVDLGDAGGGLRGARPGRWPSQDCPSRAQPRLKAPYLQRLWAAMGAALFASGAGRRKRSGNKIKPV